MIAAHSGQKSENAPLVSDIYRVRCTSIAQKAGKAPKNTYQARKFLGLPAARQVYNPRTMILVLAVVSLVVVPCLILSLLAIRREFERMAEQQEKSDVMLRPPTTIVRR